MRTTLDRLAVAALVVAAALTAAPSASAQPKKPPPVAPKSDARLAEAKKLFDEGTSAYSQGSYEQAIGLWERSYDISQKPLIFESIANAYERLGDARKSRDYLKKWKDAAPADEQPLIDQRLRNLEARVAREDEQETARKKAAEDKARKEQEAREQAVKDAADRKAALAIPGFVMLGVGGAAVIAGVALDVVASGKRPDATKVCKDSGGKSLCLSSSKDAIGSSKTLALAGDILWIAGAAVAAGGGALVLVRKLGAARDQPAQAQPTAVLAPAGAGVVLLGTF